ncbi:MAG: membrane protein insertase YidC [Flavobacteriales bacterium]
MDRNNLIGIGLMVVLYIGYILWATPSAEERAAMQEQALKAQAAQDSIVQAENEAALLKEEATAALQISDSNGENEEIIRALEGRYGSLASAIGGQDQEYVLQSDVLKLVIHSRGGMLHSATLMDGFTRFHDDEPVSLWRSDASEMDFVLKVKGVGDVRLSDLHFSARQSTDTMLTLVADAGQGKQLSWTYTLDDYRLKSDFAVLNLAGEVEPQAFFLWDAIGEANEKGIEWERQHSAIYYREEGMGRDYLRDGAEDDEELEERLDWMAFKQNFFSALVTADGGFEKGALLASAPMEEDSTATMRYQAQLPLALKSMGAASGFTLRWFFGPNDLPILETTGLEEVGRIIDYGWWIFGWVNRNMILPLYNFLDGNLTNVGLIILIITVIIKMALSPITWKNFMSSAKMRVLRPELDEINNKHKDDAMARQQATMALYRDTGVSPLAGCLPALLQMPILYAMFRFFPANIDLRGRSFLWADDLGAYDSILDLPFSIPFYGAHVSGFTILMAASTFFYMRLTMANQPPQPQQPGMPNMQAIQQIFPFMMLFFFNRFAAGLSFYYLAANVISIGQMYAIKQWFIDEDKIREQIEANKAQPKKKSSFQQRLEQMQQEQQKRTKEIKNKRNKRS